MKIENIIIFISLFIFFVAFVLVNIPKGIEIPDKDCCIVEQNGSTTTVRCLTKCLDDKIGRLLTKPIKEIFPDGIKIDERK